MAGAGTRHDTPCAPPRILVRERTPSSVRACGDRWRETARTRGPGPPSPKQPPSPSPSSVPKQSPAGRPRRRRRRNDPSSALIKMSVRVESAATFTSSPFRPKSFLKPNVPVPDHPSLRRSRAEIAGITELITFALSSGRPSGDERRGVSCRAVVPRRREPDHDHRGPIR